MKLYLVLFVLAFASLACMQEAEPTIMPLIVIGSSPTATISAGLPTQAVVIQTASSGLPERVVCASDFLNVRSGPAESWPVLYQLSAGDRVQILRWLEGWAEIKEGKWVNGDYLCH